MKNAGGIEIYENLKEIVDPRRSCLVVWDVQNGLVDRIFNKEEFLTALKKIVDGLRGKIPIIYSMITPPPREFASSWSLYSMLRRFNVKELKDLPAFMPPGSKEREIPPSIAPAPGDVVLEKPTASFFVGTNFENLMRNRRISTLIFTGIATEMGVESSARDASNRGFYPVIVSDCVSSSDKEAHERSLKNLAKIAIVEKSEEVLKSVEGALV